MTRTFVIAFALLAGLIPGAVTASEPQEALCHVCRVMSGEEHAERVRATRTHDGVTYGFCSEECAGKFELDPIAFLPPVFPRPAPEFERVSLTGDTLSLSRLRGRVALVDFWATWCVPCRKSMPELSAVHERWADRGFTVIGISIDEDRETEVRRFLEKTRVAYPIAIDDRTAPAWSDYLVKAVPAAFLLDAQGRIVAQWTGRTVDPDELEARLTELLIAD